MDTPFTLNAPFKPAGDQPRAIEELCTHIEKGSDKQTLLGVTGSGKTFVISNVIQQTQKPALVISHNKTLAAQLAEEFREFFPKNAVEYFVSYYDYYQPEAYIPRTDTYIAKDSSINEEIDRLRHKTMDSVLTRNDVIIVASVSCIYGLGAPEDYLASRLILRTQQRMPRKNLLLALTELQYARQDTDIDRGTYRVRGDVIDIRLPGEEDAIRIELFGDIIDTIMRIDGLTGEVLSREESISITPATLFMTTKEKKKRAMDAIQNELEQHVHTLKKRGKNMEAARILQRTTYDLEMIEELGYVSGIENYSRHLDNRKPGEPPSTLIDYFIHHFGQDGFHTYIDESHMTIPQIGAMYGGDAARKKTLIEHGFRLPSAADNRPLKFHEFEHRIRRATYVSATPGPYEHNTSTHIIELIARPTGLLDPVIDIRPTKHQIDDVIDRIQERVRKKQRVLVTTLTKKMAEELSTYLTEMGMKAAYIHSDVDTLERIDILRNLREGVYDVLVGINLLREGLDLPEVSLVAIMDADKEGYLRSETAIIQIMGRAARHLNGHVIMYADRITRSMKAAMDETQRRRTIQEAYNKKHGITPASIVKKIRASHFGRPRQTVEVHIPDTLSPHDGKRMIEELSKKMHLAAQNLEFEKAAQMRDMIRKVRSAMKK